VKIGRWQFGHWRTSDTLRASARLLRREQTRAEQVLWQALRNRQAGGLKFRRQHAFRWCVVDLYCPECRLAIEIDGPIHDGEKERDQERDNRLAREGIRVLRLTNDQVLHALDETLQLIAEVAREDPFPLEPRV